MTLLGLIAAGSSGASDVEERGEGIANLTECAWSDSAEVIADASSGDSPDVLALRSGGIGEAIVLVGLDDDLCAAVPDRPSERDDLDNVWATTQDPRGRDDDGRSRHARLGPSGRA